MKNKLKGRNVIVGVTGSIAAYKSCNIVSGLRRSGIEVNIIMTKHACKFITPLTLQTISGNRVHTDMFDNTSWQPEHIQLSQKTDLILIAPASADVIAKIACGIADELLLSVVLASKKPVLIAPAMNENMYNNKITQSNIRKLKSLDYLFIPPDKGKLASGDVGVGRLAEPSTIIKKAEELLLKKNPA